MDLNVISPFSMFNVTLWLFTAITLYKPFHLSLSFYIQTLYCSGYFMLKMGLTLVFSMFLTYHLAIIFRNIFMTFIIAFAYFYINSNSSDLYNTHE